MSRRNNSDIKEMKSDLYEIILFETVTPKLSNFVPGWIRESERTVSVAECRQMLR